MRIVLDASSLISVSQTCLVRCIGELSDKLGAEFCISPAVKDEVVSRPLGIKRFALNAVRINTLVKENKLSVKELDPAHRAFAEKLSEIANNMFLAKGRPIRIMQAGEIETLALMKQLNSKTIVVDERTTRMLIENPLDLHSLIEHRHKKNIKENRGNIREFQGFFSDCVVLRSVELIALAFEMNALAGELENTPKALESALYAAKFAGCSVGFEEINEFLAKERVSVGD